MSTPKAFSREAEQENSLPEKKPEISEIKLPCQRGE